MIRRSGHVAAVLAAGATLAAAAGAAGPAGAAEHHVASTAAAGCNAFVPEGSTALGGLDGLQAAMRGAARGRTEKPTNAGDIDIPAGEEPSVAAGFSVVIPTHFHVINNGPKAADGNVSDAKIQAQMRVLNQTFAGTGFSFSLASVDRTTNADWYFMTSSLDERAAKDALHRGDASHLNLYTNEGAGFLGWATFPKDAGGRSTLDGVVVAAGLAARREHRQLRPGQDRDARGRPLAGALPHVPERLLGGGRRRRRHARAALAHQRLPGGPRLLPHGPGAGPDPQLHGLLLRQVLHGVHPRPGGAHGRAVALLPRRHRLAAAARA